MTKIKYLDSGELIRFFDQVKKGSVRDLILFSLAYRYGLRVSELVQIKLTDLSPSPYKPVEISIRRAKGGIGRNYPISFDDSKLLKKWLRQRSKIDPSGSNPFLFITPRSGQSHIAIDSVKGLFTKYALKAGIDRAKAHIHVLRHTCATQLLSSGCDLYFCQNYLGHKSYQSTLVYANLMPVSWSQRSFLAVQSLATT